MDKSPAELWRDLLDEAEASAALPLQQRAAHMIPQHRQMRELGQLFLAYHDAFAAQHRELISQVYELLGTITAHSNGRHSWTSELPPGTAPEFRRRVNSLIKHLNDDEG